MLIYRELRTCWMCVKHEETSVRKKGEGRYSGINTMAVQETKFVPGGAEPTDTFQI